MQDVPALLDSMTYLFISHTIGPPDPSFSIATFENFPGIYDLFSEAPKFQQHTKLCYKCSTLLI